MAIGPSTTTAPYLLGSEPNVRFTSIITVGDAVPGSTSGVFGGVPDGLGVYDNGDGTITVLVNHEIGNTAGVLRDHGAIGSYVDRLIIDKATLQVVSGDDLFKQAYLWNTATQAYDLTAVAFNRFCSGDLPAVSAFYDASTGLGTQSRIYLTGEEAGDGGRPIGAILGGAEDGRAYELAALGNQSFENLVANPYAQTKTIVATTDDTAGGQVYFYVGNKQSTGTEVQKAGLDSGILYGLKVTGIAAETNGNVGAFGSFTLEAVGADGNVKNLTGTQIQSASVADGITGFLRPEDAAWDPDHPNTLYFVTTNAFGQPSRLWQATFTDITRPELGGTIKAVLDGTECQQMLDNMTVADGKVILQEDPGNQGYLAKVWEYDIASDTLTEAARFDPALFVSGTPGFITQDEESSGVIDVTDLLGDSDTHAYLLDAQVHKATGVSATVEQGQLMVMYVDDPFLIGGNGIDSLFGSAANETLRGYNGDDVALAGSGNDLLYGGNGDDRLDGGAGNDSLYGERGDDVLIGGTGNDQLWGGQGADIFIVDNRGETGADKIFDFTGGDRLWTTVQLADPDGDGRVLVDADHELNLFGASEVAITNNGKSVDALRYDGSVTVDGTTYYAYAADGGNGGGNGGGLGMMMLSKMMAHDLLFG